MAPLSASPFRLALRPSSSPMRMRLRLTRASHSGPPREKPDTPPVPGPVPISGPAPAPLPLWQRLGPLTRAAEAYSHSQRVRPYLTQFVSALVIYFCADISAQRISGKPYEPGRTVRGVFIGTLAAIPYYRWMLYLSHSFNYSSRWLSVAARIFVNQTLLPPFFNSYFFGMQALLSGETLEAAVERIKNTVPISLINSWKFWPLVNAVSFLFIPVEHRAVFANIISIGWQTYLSFLNRQAETEQHAHPLPSSKLVEIDAKATEMLPAPSAST
ncbi:hypothetical protein B0I35DRAFT_476574 [Stachybotrys elegans]|uniref:Uncharacterized protein n=1 Tax=Stachybotrys elegans TaxID=80388 RepID=A0A8K0SRG0_9HYPO|nr:hypothetical protein B0I35DRAFT_476574 [Stachybotrys elegans]